MVEFSTDGLGQMVFEAIRGSDTTVRLQLYKNILLSGGTTMLPGFPDRLKADVVQSWKTFVRKNPQTDVKAPVEVIVSTTLLGSTKKAHQRFLRGMRVRQDS